MQTETLELISLTKKPYEQYNEILPLIKHKLGPERVSKFESTLTKELPLTTAREAYQAAIRKAMGEPDLSKKRAVKSILGAK